MRYLPFVLEYVEPRGQESRERKRSSSSEWALWRSAGAGRTLLGNDQPCSSPSRRFPPLERGPASPLAMLLNGSQGERIRFQLDGIRRPEYSRIQHLRSRWWPKELVLMHQGRGVPVARQIPSSASEVLGKDVMLHPGTHRIPLGSARTTIALPKDLG